jgi:hypothetical protein
MKRTIARGILVLVAAMVAYVYYVPLGHTDFVGRWGDGTFGVNFPQGGPTTVESVDPGSSADRAGVRPGDRAVINPFSQAFTALGAPRTGERRVVSFLRPDGSTLVAHLTATPVQNFGLGDRVWGVVAMLPGTIFLIIAFLLVYLRPSVMTWAFAFYAIGYLSTSPSYEYFSGNAPAWFFVPLAFVLSTAFGSFAPLALVPFVLRFPSDELRGWRKKADIAIWLCLAAAYLAYAYQWYVAETTSVFNGYGNFLGLGVPLLGLAASAAIVISNYKTAPPERRQRVRFLVLGFIISVLAYAAYFVPAFSDSAKQIIGYAVVLMPIGVAYAVLQHRVLDINFVLNRAIAYAMVSIAVIAFVSLLDWLFGRVVSYAHFATIVELVVTICLGFLLDRINRAVGDAVEAVLFRKRHEAERFLKRVAAALPYATVESSISDSLLHEPVEALELSAAALYRRSSDGRRFEGIATSENAQVAPAGFERDHNLVRFMKSEEKIVWLDEVRSHLDPENSRIYVLAVPILVRHELESFVLYGAHRNGAQIDPDEVRLLEELAREAARAYDHVDAVRTRELLVELRAREALPGTA